MLKLITGNDCPSCGRDNSEYNQVCTSADCGGVILYSAAPELLEALKHARAIICIHNQNCKSSTQHIGAVHFYDEAIRKAEGK